MAVLIIHNGSDVGAYNQSVGIARIINGQKGQVSCIEAPVRYFKLIPILKILIKLKLFRYIGPFGFFKCIWNLCFISSEIVCVPDHIITIQCGTRSEFAALALSQYFRAKSIIIRQPKYLDLEDFFMVVATEGSIRAPNVVNVPLAPDHIVYTDIRNAPLLKKDLGLWCFLVGGSCASISFSAEDYHQLVKVMTDIAKRQNIKWLISTSPRTDDFGVEIIKNFALESGFVQDIILWPDTNSQQYASFLNSADICFVTEESISMISICITAQKPVYAYTTQSVFNYKLEEFYNKNQNDIRIRTFLEQQISKKRIARVSFNNIEGIPHSYSFEFLKPSEQWESLVERKLQELTN